MDYKNLYIHTSQSGRPYYISSTSHNGFSTIKYTDTGEMETVQTSRLKIAMDKQHLANKAYWDSRPKTKNKNINR